MRIVKQLTSSVIATGMDLVVLIVLGHGVGMSAGIAAVIAALAGGAINFTIGRVWVFEARGPVLSQAIGYAAIVVGGGALLTGAVVGCVAAAGAPLLVAKALSIALVMLGWTYPMSALIFARR